MIKFLYCTDPHVRRGSFSSRTDDFEETIFKKLTRFFELGKEKEVDFFLCGGDIVHSPNTPPALIAKLGELFKKHLVDVPMYMVWGNHDIYGYNPATSINTNLGLFVHFFDNIIPLSKEKTTFKKDGESVTLSGCHSYTRLDKVVETDDSTKTKESDYISDADIHIVHGYLTVKPILDDIPHTVLSPLIWEKTKAKITLTGHEHLGFGIVEHQGKSFCNPGALARVSATVQEMNRTPMYVYGEIHEDGTHCLSCIPCDVALPGSHILSRDKIEEKKELEEKLQHISNSVERYVKETKVATVSELLQMTKETVSKDVYDDAVKRINKF